VVDTEDLIAQDGNILPVVVLLELPLGDIGLIRESSMLSKSI